MIEDSDWKTHTRNKKTRTRPPLKNTQKKKTPRVLLLCVIFCLCVRFLHLLCCILVCVFFAFVLFFLCVYVCYFSFFVFGLCVCVRLFACLPCFFFFEEKRSILLLFRLWLLLLFVRFVRVSCCVCVCVCLWLVGACSFFSGSFFFLCFVDHFLKSLFLNTFQKKRDWKKWLQKVIEKSDGKKKVFEIKWLKKRSKKVIQKIIEDSGLKSDRKKWSEKVIEKSDQKSNRKKVIWKSDWRQWSKKVFEITFPKMTEKQWFKNVIDKSTSHTNTQKKKKTRTRPQHKTHKNTNTQANHRKTPREKTFVVFVVRVCSVFFVCVRFFAFVLFFSGVCVRLFCISSVFVEEKRGVFLLVFRLWLLLLFVCVLVFLGGVFFQVLCQSLVWNHFSKKWLQKGIERRDRQKGAKKVIEKHDWKKWLTKVIDKKWLKKVIEKKWLKKSDCQKWSPKVIEKSNRKR